MRSLGYRNITGFLTGEMNQPQHDSSGDTLAMRCSFRELT